MTPEEATWVRANVWTQSMRKTHREVPGYFTSCACQHGITGTCRNGSHSLCPRGAPLPRPIGYLCGPAGNNPAYFEEPYEHPHLTATGRHPTAAAMLWYADRLCRWVCPCICHLTGPVTIRPAEDALFEVVA